MKRISEHDLNALTNTLSRQDNFVFLESSKVSEQNHQSLLFTEPIEWLICRADASASIFLQEMEQWRAQGKYLAGWFAYEFAYLLEPTLHHFLQSAHRIVLPNRPLAVLGVFNKPTVFDHCSNLNLNFGAESALDAEDTGGFEISNMQTNIEQQKYLSAINRVKEYIAAGHTYQVNYTMKLKFDFSGYLADLYRTLRRNQSVSYGAWIRRDGHDIMSFSPELFYRINKDSITVRPMKGTLARGRTTDEDKINREFLQNDPKNRSENIMIVDLLRNDLGRLLYNIDGGAVQPKSIFDIETFETLFQMTSTIEGVLTSGKQPSLQDVLKAIYPCGSITGAPKIRTMEIIHELEPEERGVYCGAIGYSGPEESVFNVPIRTLVIRDGQGEMGIGGGIIHDSDPEDEWRESLLKGNFLTHPPPEFHLIETILWQPESGYWLIKEHLERLADSAEYFLFSVDIDEIKGVLSEAVRLSTSAQKVRLLLSRDGSFEITTTELMNFRFSDPCKPQSSTPLKKAAFARQQTDPTSRYLYHKTTSRKLYNDARARATELDLYEMLFTNNKGEVTEGSITNIFIEKDGLLMTPPIKSGVLNGTLRRFLIAKGNVEERILLREDIHRADKVYLGNSVSGLVQVEVLPDDC